MARVAQLDDADLPAPLDRRAAEVDAARVAQLVEVVERELRRPQHRVDQMPAGLGIGQHVAEERALGDLQALLVLLQQLALGLATCSRVGSSGTCSAAA